ncbi:MAG TPA: hypothetical protein VIV61_08265 [Candidatus Ozemobacteraceae bacterium]
MEKGSHLTLVDVGDIVFRVMQNFLFREQRDPGVEVTINSNAYQESLFLRLPDFSTLLIKIFPHRNFMNAPVFRTEVYKTKSGDMRGNRIAFVEISLDSGASDEIRLFIEGVLSQLGF